METEWEGKSLPDGTSSRILFSSLELQQNGKRLRVSLSRGNWECDEY